MSADDGGAAPRSRGARGPRRRVVIDGRVLVDDHFSGIGHYAMNLLDALDDLLEDVRDFDVRLVVPFDRRGEDAVQRFRNLRLVSLPVPYRVYRHLMARDLMPPMDRLLGRGVYFFPDYVRWPLSARSRSITAVHDLSFVKVPDAVDRGNREFLRPRVETAVRTSDAVTALTRTMATEIVEEYGIDAERVRVVGCAADTRHFYRRSEREIADVTRRHGIFGDYLVSVGNLEPRKNHARLIEAFGRLPDELADRFTLVLVGAGSWNDGPIRRRIEEALSRGRKVIVLLGSVTDRDMPALYSGATASAYVSIYEGFGMPPLESMAVGTPVLGSDVSVMPEVLGDAAVFADPLDVDDLARALSEVLSSTGAERQDLIRRGYANVARYSWRDAAVELLDLLREMGELR